MTFTPHLGENSFFWQMPKGLTEEEREYYKVNAKEMCDIFGALFTDGVTAEHMLENDKQTDKDVIGSSLAVIAGDGLKIVVSVGSAMVNKHLYIAILPIQLDVTEGTNDVILRCDTTTENPFVTAIVRKRTTTNLIDNITRTANIYEVPLATVTVPTGAKSVLETMIVDHRLNTNLASDGKPFCGLMKPRPNADTKGIWEDWTRLQAEIINTWKTFEEKTKQEWETQKQGFNNDFDLIVQKFNTQIADNQKTFVEWFENLQTYLEGDVAANLAGEITKLKINKADKNTVYTKQEIDSKLSEKTDLSVTTQLSEKVDFTRTYTLTHTKLRTVHTLSDLPTGRGIYQCQFIAQADYTEGDTFTGYTAKPTGEETVLPEKAFVKGDIVSITVDTVNKKLGFKIGGSGVNQTLPPQVTGFAVTSGNAKVTVSFNEIPAPYNENLKDYVLVYKAGGIPTGVNDGIKVVIPK